jgi:AcrR family transcriptional regulator
MSRYHAAMSLTTSAAGTAAAAPDRRARRRGETIDEILAIAVEVMTEVGVNGLSLSEIARRLGVKPPSLYKYFDSLHAIYDELFRRGQLEHLEVIRAAMVDTSPGLEALRAGLDASGRWCLDNRALAQLLFWRPVPSFEPSTDALQPSQAMIELQRHCLADAAAVGELGPDGATDEVVYLVSTFITGVLSQALANEPNLPWGQGRFTPLFPKLMDLLPVLYPPAERNPRKAAGQRGRSSIT